MFRAMAGTGDVAPQKYSAWASLAGTLTIKEPCYLGSGVISGSTAQISRVRQSAGRRGGTCRGGLVHGNYQDQLCHQVEYANHGSPQTGHDQTRFRVKVTGAAGAGSVTSSAVTIGVVSSVSRATVFTQQLTDQTVYEGGSYSGHATSNLLNGTDAEPYAVAIVEYDDGKRSQVFAERYARI